MGYPTSFEGSFTITPPLEQKHRAYLSAFYRTRRMKRDAELTSQLPDPRREAVSLPVGKDGGFYVGDQEEFGQSRTPDIIDYNDSPGGQPNLWCRWTPNRPGTTLSIPDDGNDYRCYDYVEWLQYLIDNFLGPWGYKLDGETEWQGEEPKDQGKIVVKDNVIRLFRAEVTFIEVPYP